MHPWDWIVAGAVAGGLIGAGFGFALGRIHRITRCLVDWQDDHGHPYYWVG